MTESIDDLKNRIDYLEGVIESMTGVGSTPISGLTKHESHVVELLTNANGRVVSEQGIHDAIYWDHDDPPMLNIVRVWVHRIRKARPDIPIQTVWGAGYCIPAEYSKSMKKLDAADPVNHGVCPYCRI